MPLPNFEGCTFVAFMDISGFKKLMKENKAQKALNSFHNHGYGTIRRNRNINGLFASDSCILFVNRPNGPYDIVPTDNLVSLLGVIKEMNENLLRDGFMVTTSIAYGHFRYENRVEFNRIEKNHFFGNAYVNAFLDNDYGKKKIRPGECRLLIDTLPKNIKSYLSQQEAIGNSLSEDNLELLIKENEYYYFYWMVRNPSRITNFERNYNHTYNSRYQMIKSLIEEEIRRE